MSSSLMSLLSVQGERRSRSKSPGGRERSRSRSNVREERSERSEPKRDSNRRKSSKKYSESESDSGADRKDQLRYQTRSPSQYDEDDRGKRRNSARADVPDPNENRHRTYARVKNGNPDLRRRDSDSDDARYKSSGKTASKRRSDSDSESESREGRRGKDKSTKARPTVVTAAPAAGPPKVAASAMKSPVQVQSPYGQVNAYSYAPLPGQAAPPPGAFPELPHGALSETRHVSYAGGDPRFAPPPVSGAPRAEDYRQRASFSGGQQYAQVGQFQYAQVDPRVSYKDPNSAINVYAQPPKPQVDPRRSDSKIMDKRYTEDKYQSREIERERPRGEEKVRPWHEDPRESKVDERERRYSEAKVRPWDQDPKEKKLDGKLGKEDDKSGARRLSRLSIGAATGAATLGIAAAHHGSSNGDKPPPSPLLEAYHGTYQSISPMPSALVLAGHKFDSDISDVDLDSDDSLSDLDPDAERKKKIKRLEKEKQWIQKKNEKEESAPLEYERRRPSDARFEVRTPDDDQASSVISSRSSRKKVSWYPAEDDAKDIAAALKGSKPPNIKPLIRILPFVSMEDLEALKAEYKNHATIGGQGINMSKHIKARVTGHIGKAAYACSLGQYEGDAYWANCFYQSGASRRELLIESLMGRTNQQIREIKNFFKDKKYDDDLEKCLKAELKADKFRSAILLALEERRQAESPVLDPRLVRHDVADLYEALNSAGGESAMIQIIVVRSDAHLREVLRQYERKYGHNFARDMISKSRNLVGETLAHILNGALNRSMRDALLLHQAIAETAPGKERAELLISRLVRLHWEPKHLEKVKSQYAQRYGIRVDEAIKKEIQSQMKTDEGMAWTNFCIALIRSSEQ